MGSLCFPFPKLVLLLGLAQRLSFREAQKMLLRNERKKLNTVAVGPAPWKLLRDRAAKDPALCSVAQKFLGGGRKVSAF